MPDDCEPVPWQPLGVSPELHPHALHIWRLELDQEALVPGLLTSLSPLEIARLGKYRHDRDKTRFVLGRGVLRCLLGGYLGVAAKDVVITYGPFGKPCVDRPDGYDKPVPYFNISHSGGIALMGFTLLGDIGLDVEEISNQVSFDGIASLFMSPAEALDLKQWQGDEKVEVFYRYWTCKESYMKARGKGMSLFPRSFSISPAFAPPSIIEAPECERNPERWSFRCISITTQHRAAIVCDETLGAAQYAFHDFNSELP